MKQCSKCGTYNTDNAQFCCNCGESLAAPQPKFCNNCGTPITDGNLFCPKCGKPIRQQTNSSSIPHQQQDHGFGEAIKICFKKFASFEGRATRAEYWWWALFCLLITLPTMGVGILVCMIPSISVSIRRLHDIGKGGGWYFINFIPYIGAIVFLVFMCMDSEKNDNQYGTYIG